MEDDVRVIKEIVTGLEQSYREQRRTNPETNGIVDALAKELMRIQDRVTQIEQRQINNLEILEHLVTQIAEIRSKFS